MPRTWQGARLPAPRALVPGAIYQNVLDLPEGYSAAALARQVLRLRDKGGAEAANANPNRDRTLLLKTHVRDALYLVGKFNAAARGGAGRLSDTRRILARRGELRKVA